MRAVQLMKYGGWNALQFTAEAAKPAIGAGQILVRVRAASVNVLDWKIREGMAQAMAPLHFPSTLGSDLAGSIAEIGKGVDGFVVGQEVYGQTNPLGGTGSFAEFTPIASGALAAKPQSLSFTEAAAVPLTAVSAYQALIELLDIQAGQKILIHGGAGGIGSFAIQLAKHLGAYVITTAASNDTAYVSKLGADEVIDYTSQKFEELLHGLDAVYDTVGGDTYTRSFMVVKPGGKIVSMTERPDKALAQENKIQADHLFTQVTTERLGKIAELIDQGALHVHIDKVFPLEEAAEAVEYLHEGRHHGKIVLNITNETETRQ